jgi:signal transduction histidine kinase/HAMP domain-containing protein
VSRRVGISIRWWLALVFAAMVSLTALLVAEVFDSRARDALRSQALDLAIGQTVSASQAAARAMRDGELPAVAALAADRRQFSLWVVDPDGKLLTPESSRHVDFTSIARNGEAARVTLARGRYVRSSKDGKTFVVGVRLPSRTGAVVTFTRRPELLAQLGVVREQIVRAALLAVGVGAVVGMLVATLIAARLRRIARTAATIEAGAFDVALQPRFHDELGSLAETVDQMRIRLRRSFGELKAERDKLLRLLEGLEEGVLAVGRDHRIAFANSAARSLVADEPFEAGRLVPETWNGFALRAFAGDLFADTEVRRERVLSEYRVYDLAGIPSGRGIDEAILVFADVSARERRERAEREFVANAAHELGTPLTAIQSSLEALEAGAKSDAGERDVFLELIGRQTSRLARLRRALLALARSQTQAEAVRLGPVPLPELLEHVAAELRPVAGDVAVVVQADPGVCALAHPELLEHVLLNLAENALVHASPDRVALTARAGADGTVAIEVRDDGIGIAGDDRERLFDRFYRGGDGGGFGLGLAIVREAVRALDGVVAVESQPGAGTTFTITLAAAPAVVAV